MMGFVRQRSRSGLSIGIVILLSTLLFAFSPKRAEAGSAEQGSVLSGSLIESTRPIDSRGLSTWRTSRLRSPSGILYPYPHKPMPWSGESYQLRSLVDLGFVLNSGEASEAAFRKYADLSDGFLLRRFLVEGQRTEDGRYFEVGGGSVGRSDQFFYGEIGQRGLFSLRGRFDSVEHVGIDDARILFEGVGSQELTLPSPLVPGRNLQSDVSAALVGVGQTQLSQKREQSELQMRVALHPRLTLIGDYGFRKRQGERPFGGTLGMRFARTTGGSFAETIAPEESDTHEFSAGLEYASPEMQANLRYRGSIYDNQNSSLTWENPFSASERGNPASPTAVAGPPRGRSALAPDNQLHQVSSDVGIKLPLRGRFTTHASWTRMTQNQRLLPATINPLLTNFDTLSRSRGDARVDQLLVQSKLRFRPASAVSVDFGFRYSMRDNDTNYLSLNPASGQFGYVVEDESLTTRYGAAAFSAQRLRVSGAVDWRFAKRSKIGIRYRHNSTRRENRAREEVRDDNFRLHVSTAAIPHTQLRASYTFQKRSGSNYSAARDSRYYEATGPGRPARTGGPSRTLRSFRQFDLSSHDNHNVDLRANWLIGPSVDLALAAHLELRDYHTSYGVTGTRIAEVNLDTSIQLSPRLTAHGFASYEWRDRRMATINGAIGLGQSTDFTEGSRRYPLSNRWTWDSNFSGMTLGVGLTATPVPRVALRADYRFQRSNEDIDTAFDRSGGALPPSTDPATARSRFPSLSQTDHLLDASASYAWTDTITTRAFYRYQYSTIRDFHQRGLQPVINQNLFLGHVDDDYSVHVVGATWQFRY